MHGRRRRGVHLPRGASDLLEDAGELVGERRGWPSSFVRQPRRARCTIVRPAALRSTHIDTDARHPTAPAPSPQSSPDNT
jgi:hypothetical protein